MDAVLFFLTINITRDGSQTMEGDDNFHNMQATHHLIS